MQNNLGKYERVYPSDDVKANQKYLNFLDQAL